MAVAAVSLAFCFIPLPAFAESAATGYPNARMMALGGRHAALTDDFWTIFNNPAGFSTKQPVMNLADLTIHGAGPMFDIAGMVINNSGDILADIAGLLDSQGRFYSVLDMGGPLAFGYIGKGIGFGFFNRTWAEVNAASLFSINIDAYEETALMGGYAYRADYQGGHFSIGVLPKGFVRSELPLSTNALGLQDFFSNPTGIFDSAKYTVTVGVGFDAGFTVSALNERFTWAVSGRDLYTPTFVTTYTSFNSFLSSPQAASLGSGADIVRRELDTGFAIRPFLGGLERYITRWVILADYHDLLALFDPVFRNPLLNASIGTELVLHDVFSLRAGFSDCLPSAGLAVDLTICTLEMAMYGTELGYDPGVRPVYNAVVTLNFKI